MEADIRYYRRRAYEEMSAASRAVTEAARERRLRLVDLYVQRLEALGDRNFVRAPGSPAIANGRQSAFAWAGLDTDATAI